MLATPQIGEVVKYIRFKNKKAEIVLYIEGSKYIKEEYAIKYQRGNLMVNDVVDPALLERIDMVDGQISIFDWWNDIS